MSNLRLEPGEVFNSWHDFKQILDNHSYEEKVLFNIGHAKTVEQANAMLKKPPYFADRLKYASCTLRCKHFGSYHSVSAGLRPKQRSYKIDCQAFISVSACRKEGYLIIRDSCHKHSHPCTEEIYNSYPEVRRMSNDEKNMVGTLMDMGVPVAQIKTAIGRRVTPKDLHNARSQVKRVHLDQGESSGVRRRRTYTEMEKVPNMDVLPDTMEVEDDIGGISFSPLKKIKNEHDPSVSDQTFPIIVERLDGQIVGGDNDLGIVETVGDREGVSSVEEGNGVSGLLAAAGLGSDSVVLTVNQGVRSDAVDETGKVEIQPKNSYTVTISLPDRDVTHTGTDLQELLKSLPLNKLEPDKVAVPSTDIKVEELKCSDSEGSISGKNCVKCEAYMSPLDGHDQCLQCLGPDHLSVKDCIHCNSMRPEQLSIRRKQLVRQRMKALKALQDKRMKPPEPSQDILSQSTVRKSQRVRKPKNFGPDIAVETNFVLPKEEPYEDYESTPAPFQQSDDVYGCTDPSNSERFDHMVRQSGLLNDVTLEVTPQGSLVYVPPPTTREEFEKMISLRNPPATAASVKNKYTLQQNFESKFCSEVPNLTNVTDPGTKIMASGLCKIVKNAAAQTRIAIYDQLFTRLGVGMADEALSIIGDLYGKVTQVTEISQEDLTNDLQTAIDTIQALKDVLEELGVMSTDAVSNIALQRSISINSLVNARKSVNDKAEIAVPRKKFQPFSRPKMGQMQKAKEADLSPSPSVIASPIQSMSLPSQYMKHLVVNVSSESELTSAGISQISNTTMHEVDVNQASDCATPTLISVSDKDFSSAVPFTMSSELLQTLQGGKDNIIELAQDGKDSVIELHQNGKELLQTLQGSKELLHTLQSKDGIIEFHHGVGKDLLQTSHGGKESVIELHQGGKELLQSLQGDKDNVIELHVMQDDGHQLLAPEASEEVIHTETHDQL